MVFFAESYLSAILRYGVFRADGTEFGRLEDLVVPSHHRFPVITEVAIRQSGEAAPLYYPWSAVRSTSQEGIRLLDGAIGCAEPQTPGELIHLRRDLLDKQIVDVSGKRVVRVHDLKIGAVGSSVLLTHADIGTRGILRRLGWEHFVLGLCRPLHIHFPERLIAWEHLQLPAADEDLQADRTRDVMRRMHPADLADIAEELSAPERAAFLGAMDEEVAADAMQEMERDALVAVINELTDQQASDLIDEMDPDEGADILQELPEERQNALLGLMEAEEAADLRQLLSYPEDSAGGLMTVEEVSIPQGITVAGALELVRREAIETDAVYYVHVVDAEHRLIGFFPLIRLVTADPSDSVDGLVEHDPVCVTPETDQRDVARLVARYNLLSIPVVDEEGRLQGIVTADDAIDAVIPTSWKKRIPKAFARTSS